MKLRFVVHQITELHFEVEVTDEQHNICTGNPNGAYEVAKEIIKATPSLKPTETDTDTLEHAEVIDAGLDYTS